MNGNKSVNSYTYKLVCFVAFPAGLQKLGQSTNCWLAKWPLAWGIEHGAWGDNFELRIANCEFGEMTKF